MDAGAFNDLQNERTFNERTSFPAWCAAVSRIDECLAGVEAFLIEDVQLLAILLSNMLLLMLATCEETDREVVQAYLQKLLNNPALFEEALDLSAVPQGFHKSLELLSQFMQLWLDHTAPSAKAQISSLLSKISEPPQLRNLCITVRTTSGLILTNIRVQESLPAPNMSYYLRCESPQLVAFDEASRLIAPKPSLTKRRRGRKIKHSRLNEADVSIKCMAELLADDDYEYYQVTYRVPRQPVTAEAGEEEDETEYEVAECGASEASCDPMQFVRPTAIAVPEVKHPDEEFLIFLERTTNYHGRLTPDIMKEYRQNLEKGEGDASLLLIVYVCGLFLVRAEEHGPAKSTIVKDLEDVILFAHRRLAEKEAMRALDSHYDSRQKNMLAWLKAIFDLLSEYRQRSAELLDHLNASFVYSNLLSANDAVFEEALTIHLVRTEMHQKISALRGRVSAHCVAALSGRHNEPASDDDGSDTALSDEESVLEISPAGIQSEPTPDVDLQYESDGATSRDRSTTEKSLLERACPNLSPENAFFLLHRMMSATDESTVEKKAFPNDLDAAAAELRWLFTQNHYETIGLRKDRLQIVKKLLLCLALVTCHSSRESEVAKAIFLFLQCGTCVTAREERNRTDLNLVNMKRYYRNRLKGLSDTGHARVKVENVIFLCLRLYRQTEKRKNFESLLIHQMIVMQALHFKLFGRFVDCGFANDHL